MLPRGLNPEHANKHFVGHGIEGAHDLGAVHSCFHPPVDEFPYFRRAEHAHFSGTLKIQGVQDQSEELLRRENFAKTKLHQDRL
jgi:hypothetical protein